MAHILVVDDSPTERRVITLLLGRNPDLSTTEAEGAREALNMIRQNPPDLVVTDLMMPDMDGLELVEAIRADYPGLPVILATAYGSEEVVVRALRKGAVNYVVWCDFLI